MPNVTTSGSGTEGDGWLNWSSGNFANVDAVAFAHDGRPHWQPTDTWHGSGALKDDKIARALRLIREYPGRNWTVAELASAVAMSRSAFADRFQELTSRSPMRFLSDYRLARAARYLRATPATLTEIARDTGYESDASLSRAFKRAFGVAPGAYRKTPEPAAGR